MFNINETLKTLIPNSKRKRKLRPDIMHCLAGHEAWGVGVFVEHVSNISYYKMFGICPFFNSTARFNIRIIYQ